MQNVRMPDEYPYMAKLYLIDSDFKQNRQSNEIRIDARCGMKKIIASAILNVLLIVSMFFTGYTNYGGIEKYGVAYIFSTGIPCAILFVGTGVVSVVFLTVTIIKNIRTKKHSVIAWLPVALFSASIISNVMMRIGFKGTL